MADSHPDSSVPPVERVKQEVDRWLEAVRTTGERAMETLGLSGVNRPTVPAVDIIEFIDRVVVLIDLPGVSAEMVELNISGNMLVVAANRTRQDFASDARVHLRERFVGTFQRSIPIPATINEEAISAETRNGLLTVTLKKTLPTPGRSIPVSTGNGSSCGM